MSIAKRKDGRYIVKFKDSLGRWQQRSFRDEAEARRFDGEAIYDNPDNERPTVLDCVLSFMRNTKHSRQTTWAYRFAMLGHDRHDGTHSEGPAEFLASRYADTLTFRDLNTLRDNCRARGMATVTVNMYAAKISAALNWCARHDMISANPWSKYGRLEASHKSLQGNMEDFQKIYKCCAEWLQWACRTCYALCLRPGMSELFRLTWGAFRWPAKSVTVYMGKTGSAKTVYPPEGYLAEAWARFCKDGQDGAKPVCPDRRGRCVKSASTYKNAWKRACVKAGVDMPMYGIRHLAAYAMLEGGADLAAVAAQLGHANPATTGKYYLQALPRAQKAAGNALSWCGLGAGEEEKTNKNK